MNFFLYFNIKIMQKFWKKFRLLSVSNSYSTTKSRNVTASKERLTLERGLINS